MVCLDHTVALEQSDMFAPLLGKTRGKGKEVQRKEPAREQSDKEMLQEIVEVLKGDGHTLSGMFSGTDDPTLVAQLWMDHGFDSASVEEWLSEASCSSADKAHQLDEAGLSPDDVSFSVGWDKLGYLFANNEMTLDQVNLYVAYHAAGNEQSYKEAFSFIGYHGIEECVLELTCRRPGGTEELMPSGEDEWMWNMKTTVSRLTDTGETISEESNDTNECAEPLTFENMRLMVSSEKTGFLAALTDE